MTNIKRVIAREMNSCTSLIEVKQTTVYQNKTDSFAGYGDLRIIALIIV